MSFPAAESMRPILVIAGIATLALGFSADARLDDPNLLQGTLTLGGGWLICAAFTFYSVWHGVVGGGILALLAGARCAPALFTFANPDRPAAPYQAIAFVISATVLIATVRTLIRERARRERERMMAESE